VAVALIAALLVWRHKENIARLIAGNRVAHRRQEA